MHRLVLILCIALAGSLSAWIGYRAAVSGDIHSPVDSQIVLDPTSPSATPFDYGKSRRGLLAVTRRIMSERSQASYIAYNELVAGLPEEAWPRLLVDVQAMPGSSERDRLLREIVPRLAERDPNAMYTYCMENGLTEYMLGVFEELAKDDAPMAWERVEDFISRVSRLEATKNNYVHAVFKEWAALDLPVAFAKALEIDERLTYHAAGGFSAGMSPENREAFLQSILDIPEVPETFHREHFVQFATKWMAHEDRDGALAWLYQSGVDPQWFTDTEIELADFRDPKTAADWLFSTLRGDPNERFEKMEHIAGNWANKDQEACAAWLESHGESALAERVRSR